MITQFVFYMHRDEAPHGKQRLVMESRGEILVKIGQQKRVLIALQAGESSPMLVAEISTLQKNLLKAKASLKLLVNETETD